MLAADAIGAPMAAQQRDVLPVGARVRVAPHAPHAGRLVGTVLHADSATITLARDGGASPVTLDLADVGRIDQRYLARSRGKAFERGAGVGAVVGLGLGFVATGATAWYESRKCTDICLGTAVVGIASIPVFVGTTIGGGLIGLARRERWRRVWP